MCDFSTLLVLFYVNNVVFSGGFWHHCLAFRKHIKMNISPSGFSDHFVGNNFIYLQDVKCRVYNGAVVLYEPPAAESVHRPLVSHL